MTYLEVLPLETVKLYLKVDEGQTETDAEITQMIKSSLAYIEKRTNHIFQAKDKVYYKDCALVQQVKVYDYPINDAEDLDILYRPNYAIVPTVNDTVTLSLGYNDILDVPDELIDCALGIINFWFYNSETKGADNSIPNFISATIDQNRRFV